MKNNPKTTWCSRCGGAMAAWTPAAAVEATKAAGSSVRAANGSVGSGAGAYRVGA